LGVFYKIFTARGCLTLDIPTDVGIILNMKDYTELPPLAIKIKSLRKQKDWTQRQLAGKAGVNESTLRCVECGKIKKPGPDFFIKIAGPLGTTERELYQAAGYIKDAKASYQTKETPEEILERLRVSISSTVPVYEDFPFHAGVPVEPIDYAPVMKERARGKNLEGYIARGNCLEPVISDGNIIIVDRDGQIDQGDIIACLVNGEIHLARLRKIADDLYLEDNHGRFKLEDCQIAAPVIEVRRRLK